MTSNPWPDKCCLDAWQTDVSAALLQVEACVPAGQRHQSSFAATHLLPSSFCRIHAVSCVLNLFSFCMQMTSLESLPELNGLRPSDVIFCKGVSGEWGVFGSQHDISAWLENGR